MLVLFRKLGNFLRFGWFGLRRFRWFWFGPCIGRFKAFFFLRHSLLLCFWLSSAGLPLVAEYLGLRLAIFAFRLPLVGGDFYLSEQRIVFLGDQASTFVHPFL
jgi:hypothetical protein